MLTKLPDSINSNHQNNANGENKMKTPKNAIRGDAFLILPRKPINAEVVFDKVMEFYMNHTNIVKVDYGPHKIMLVANPQK